MSGLLVVIVSTTVFAAADWNQWRGPNRDGVALNSPPLAEAWDPSGPPKLWQNTNDIPASLSSISIADNKAYVFGNWIVDNHTLEGIVCLDANGNVLWQKKFPGKSGNQGPNSTPCIEKGRCYAAGNETLYCLDVTRNGDEIWKAPLLRSEIASSPMMIDGVVVILGGQLLGFDANTGRQLWKAPLEGYISSPVTWTADDKQKYIVCLTWQGLACVRPGSGELRWKTPASGGQGTAVVNGNMVVWLGIDGKTGLTAYRLAMDKAEKIWAVPMADRGSSPVIYDGCVYIIGANRIACYGLEKGDMKWETKFSHEISSPFVADGKLFGFVSNGDNLMMVRASPQKYELLGKFASAATYVPSPTIADGRLYMRVNKGVACYDLKKSSVAPGPASSSAD